MLNVILFLTNMLGTLAYKTAKVMAGIVLSLLAWYLLAPYTAFFARSITPILFNWYNTLFLSRTYDLTTFGGVALYWWDSGISFFASSHAADWAYVNAPIISTVILGFLGYKLPDFVGYLLNHRTKETPAPVICVCPNGEKVEGKTQEQIEKQRKIEERIKEEAKKIRDQAILEKYEAMLREQKAISVHVQSPITASASESNLNRGQTAPLLTQWQTARESTQIVEKAFVKPTEPGSVNCTKPKLEEPKPKPEEKRTMNQCRLQ